MTQTDPKKNDIRLALRIGLTLIGLVALMVLALFVVSDDWGWTEAWLYLGLSILLSLTPRWIAARRHPGFLAERAKFIRAEGIKPWDRLLVFAIALPLPLATWITAALDRRFFWTSIPMAGWELAGLIGLLMAALLVSWAMVENAFYSSVVRVQQDRGQQVVQSGPYRFIRHPGYLAGAAASLSTALLLGSLWALLPAALCAALFILRTGLEDRTLQQELPGYGEYFRRVRFRLIPGIW
jgi:protein-S-isoprenylcysteine O-methyltransferase Ste14